MPNTMHLDIRLHCELTVGTGGRIFRFAEVESGGAWGAMLKKANQDTTWGG
jgi:hypothetical protein